MFQLLTPHDATLTTFTGRTERHGDEGVPALSFGLKFEAVPNTMLTLLSDTLLTTLYSAVPGQAQLPGVEPSMPLLRCKDIGTIPLESICYEGWTVHIEHGFDGFITVLLAKIDGFKVTPHEGGTVDIMCRVATSKISPEDVAALWTKQKSGVSVMILAPAKDAGPVIDGSTEAFERDHPAQGDMLDERDAGDVFAEQHGVH